MVHRSLQVDMDKDKKRQPEEGPPVEPCWRKTKWRRLPAVFVYVGWALCLLAALASAFFTFMYSLQWGGDKANRWLGSFLLTATESITIFSTGQVCFHLLKTVHS